MVFKNYHILGLQSNIKLPLILKEWVWIEVFHNLEIVNSILLNTFKDFWK